MIDTEWILDLIESWWARHLLATTITKPDEGDGDPVDSIGGWQDPVSREVGQIPAARVEMFGHAFVPPRGQRCRALLRKAAGIVWPLGSKRYRPKGMKEGESCLYCTKEGTTVWLKADGSLWIDAAPSQDVVVNQGAKKVCRVGDTGKTGIVKMVVADVPPPAPAGTKQVTFTYTDPIDSSINLIGSLTFSAAGLLAAVPAPDGAALRTELDSGADRFKA